MSGTDFSRLSINTATIKKATLAEAVRFTADAGLGNIGLWRNRVAETGLETAAKLVRAAGLNVTSLCRGGFLTAADDDGRLAALADNRAAILEAVALGTSELIMVVGGLPAAAHVLGGDGSRADKDIVAARARIKDRLAELAGFAAEHGVRLVLEALHPMYAADRALVSTLGQALDLAADFDPAVVGVVVDTFHVFWDPQLREQIARAGRERRIAAYQVCDFNLPIAADALLSRGYMGDGYVDFGAIGNWIAAAGYTGPVEVEIFNQDIWDSPPSDVIETVKQRYAELILPSLEPSPPN